MKTKEEQSIDIKKEKGNNLEYLKERFLKGVFIPEDKRKTIEKYAEYNEYTRGFLKED